jgi:hypothetical protein
MRVLPKLGTTIMILRLNFRIFRKARTNINRQYEDRPPYDKYIKYHCNLNSILQIVKFSLSVKLEILFRENTLWSFLYTRQPVGLGCPYHNYSIAHVDF